MVTTPGGIANNGFGYAVTFGAVRDLDTTGDLVSETWNEGDHLYLSPTTPGTLTNVLPGTPNFIVELGLVVRKNANEGVIGFNPLQAIRADVALTDASDHYSSTEGAIKAYVDAISALKGDGTIGRVMRLSRLVLADGSDADTLKITLIDFWNGDAIAETDNVAKGATTGSFTLNAAGKLLTFPVTGDLIAGLSTTIYTNDTGTYHSAYCGGPSGTDMLVNVFGLDGLTVDLTALVDSGAFTMDAHYITSA
jgi:hypothetical protein